VEVGPRGEPLCRLIDEQVGQEDRRLRSADWRACDEHLEDLWRWHTRGGNPKGRPRKAQTPELLETV
jgi:hypothetical protein